MKFTLKPRKISWKDFSAHKTHKLGAIPFQDELLFLSPILNQADPNGTEDCTAFQAVSVRANEVLIGNFDPMQFWADELAFNGVTASDGFDLKTPAAVGVEYGFSPIGNLTLRQNKAVAYYWITAGGGQDLFDNIRSIIQQFQRPVSAGLLWYNEYTVAQGGILSDNGKTLLGGHAVKIAGWKTINGAPYLVIQNSWGTGYGDNGLFYMPRALVNKAFTQFGCYYWSDDASLQVQKLGLLQALLQNLVNLYQTLIKNTAGFPPPSYPSVTQWANAIAKAEGANPKINNPGDLKVSTLTKSWGATNGFQASDGGWIAAFATYEQGLQALINFLTLGKENELIAFHSSYARTLEGFTQIFAGNPPKGYYETIYNELGVDGSFQISNFTS